MNRKLSTTTGDQIETETEKSTLKFFTETIEVNRLSALAFFEAGEESFANQRYYWQNREKTFTLVGLGYAHIITSHSTDQRFDDVEQQWKKLTQHIVTNDKELQPILFGGFTFDPENGVSGEWEGMPPAFFVVATYQLVIRNDHVYISTNYIAEQENPQILNELCKKRDELMHTAQVKALKTYAKPKVKSSFEPFKEEYLESIHQVTSLIRQKEADKVVIARSLALEFEKEVSSPNVLSQIILEQPESYLFGLEHNEKLFFGASPERLVKVENSYAYSSCVAGSVKRGKTAEEDEGLGQSLLNDAKNRSEHQYVVDMIGHTFKENCASYTIPSEPRLLKIRDIQHLYTPVEGHLKNGATILQLVKTLHPTPALGGVPRMKAMEVIRKYEPMNRGLYAAPIGWLDANGNGEFAVAIRSALLHQDKAYLYAGGGIVADSQPQSEYEETLVKFRPMIRALGGQLHE
ncbi:isochorismate synthase [Rummeliibacillus sp. TYF005]|uniref:isochorismate synthase n=1 Tax=Rummeliibacillus sp. TYF005 TaxID=2058214 RepID=UPI000F527C4E|nr:isochorismate synthase [Rummeliibacillus sp. TYF005]RPJ94697.1 isochorismate synthase [Rummeliibacillus sp. TYF005]